MSRDYWCASSLREPGDVRRPVIQERRWQLPIEMDDPLEQPSDTLSRRRRQGFKKNLKFPDAKQAAALHIVPNLTIPGSPLPKQHSSH